MDTISVETVPVTIGVAIFAMYTLLKYPLQVPLEKLQDVEEPSSKQKASLNEEPAPEPILEEGRGGSINNGIMRPMLLFIVCLMGLFFLRDVPVDDLAEPVWQGEEQEETTLKLESLNHTASLLAAEAIDASEPNAQVPKVNTEDALLINIEEQAMAVTAASEASAADETKMALQEVSAPALDDWISEAPLTVPVTRLLLAEGTEDEHFKSAYLGTLAVGNPKQLLSIVFDTGSGQVVLPSAYCNSKACKMHKRYRRSSSDTGLDVNFEGSHAPPGVARDSMTVSYGTGDISGVAVEDTICMDGTAETHTMNKSAARMGVGGCNCPLRVTMCRNTRKTSKD